MEKILNKCPICGAGLEYIELYQYNMVYKVLKNGKISSRRIRKEDVGPMECAQLLCTNENCDFATDFELRSDVVKIGIQGDVFVYEEK